MPKKQPKFGQIFDADGKLVADHGNLPPSKLDPAHEPLQRFYKTELELAQLSNLDENNPAVLDYLSGAYLQWIEQGAAAFRVDTIRLMPVEFWERFAARIRAKHPGFFMFGEAFDYDAKNIAPFTHAKNGGYSVLDFPLKGQLAKVFGREHGDYALIEPVLFLKDGPYKNPYELATFYDNHDMARLDADDNGFIDAHNFLFTARGIPVVYYGSEIGFMRGRAEHAGNRNYFGVERIETAKSHPIHEKLKRIARLRAKTPALQRGVQVNLEMKGDRAAFLRVYQHAGVHQTALVLLNKGDAATSFTLRDVAAGKWRDAFGGASAAVVDGGVLEASVAAHDVRVFLLDALVSDAARF
jgi:cyclomaltodextrin glucanotransferase